MIHKLPIFKANVHFDKYLQVDYVAASLLETQHALCTSTIVANISAARVYSIR